MANDPNDYSDIIAQLSSISGNQEKLDALKEQMAQAEALRSQPPHGGMAGNVYVGPSWTQSLGSALGNYASLKAGSEATKGMKDVANQDREARMAFMQKLADAIRAKQAPSQSLPAADPDPNSYAGQQQL